MAAVDKYEAEVKRGEHVVSGTFFVYRKSDKEARLNAIGECKKASKLPNKSFRRKVKDV